MEGYEVRYASIRSDPPAHLKAIMDAVYAVTELATHPKTAVVFFFTYLVMVVAF